MEAALPLKGKTIVITRPERQSVEISERLTNLGATVIKFPLIAIEPPADIPLAQSKLKKVATYDYLIFTSRNAVEMALELLAELFPEKTPAELFASREIAAVGKRTAETLSSHGVVVSIVPDAVFNSEALLNHEALAEVETKRIGIIRGDAGRDLLQRTLQQRGARVEYIDVYRRVCPVTDLLPLVKCQQQAGVDIIMLTSVEGLTHLFRLGQGQELLEHMTLLMGSQRIADTLNNLQTVAAYQGKVIVAEDPSDDNMISSLLNWASTNET